VSSYLRSVLLVPAAAWRIDARRAASAGGLLAGAAVAAPLGALAFKQAIDAVVAHAPLTAVVYSVIAAATVVVNLLFQHFAHFFYFELADLHLIELERELATLAQGTASIAQHERPDYADRLELLRGDTDILWAAVETHFQAIFIVVQIGLTAVLLGLASPYLLLLPLFALPSLLAGRVAQNRVEDARQAHAADARQATHLLELVTSPTAAAEARMFRLHEVLRRRQASAWERLRASLERAEAAAVAVQSAGQLAFGVGYAGAVIIAVRETVVHHGPVGRIGLVMTLAAQVQGQVGRAFGVVQSLQRSARSAERLLWLREVSREPSRSGRPRTPAPSRIAQGLTLEGVGFRYTPESDWVLRDVDLHLPPGSTVALIGDNGAGKSTLIKLLCRFYEPTSGTIRLDGIDIADLDIDDWRERITAAFQDYMRFETTVRESVGVGALPQLDDPEAVSRTLERAQAAPIVDALPQGVETLLGKQFDDGFELSGGQWQRLAIARAMMRSQPLLLLLDEPASALDPSTEHALFAAYTASARTAAAAVGAITVFVSHRFSTLTTADLIIVLRDGAAAEVGTHATLMDAGGTYAELYELQAASYR